MYSFEFFDGAIVISTSGIKRINYLNIKKLQSLVKNLAKNPCQYINLDLNGINFIDSEAFRVLMRIAKSMERFDICFRLINLNSELKEIIDLVPEAEFLTNIPQEKVTEEIAEMQTV